MPTVNDIHEAIQRLVPDDLAESWDNVGLLAGSRQQEVHRILLALDASVSVARQAAATGADLIITHHPAIFKPIRHLLTDTPTGAFLAAAMRQHISVIACHTSLDSTAEGVSHSLAAALGLEKLRPLVPAGRGFAPICGLGSIGAYATAISAEELVARLRAHCAPPWILAAGRRPETVHCVALCAGSGSELAELALSQDADVYITAEVKHHVARWAEDAGIWILDAGHFPTENPAMPLFARELRELFAERHWEIPIGLAEQTTPLGLLWPPAA